MTIEELAAWSPWTPFREATPPRRPGVYLARTGRDGPLIYVGMAGERSGRGLEGRIAVYRTGKGAVTGLGEACMDRALTDPDWIRAQLARVEAGEPARTKQWAIAAIDRADLHLRWAVTPTRQDALNLERAVIAEVGADLWNRRR